MDRKTHDAIRTSNFKGERELAIENFGKVICREGLSAQVNKLRKPCVVG